MEFFHIHLYDILQRDVRWILSPGEPEKSKIETLVLQVNHSNMIELYEGAGKTSGRSYVSAKMSVNSQRKSYDVEIRLRGSRHWHHLSRKKSMKIKVIDGTPYRGHRVFNLLNQATPLVIGQKIIADTASENGVMAPPYEFVRVVLNGEDLGVFHFQAQPDDTLFRKNRTMFSDFYSGNLSESEDQMALWEDTSHWKKVASQLHSNSEDIRRLEEFLKNISNASYAQFASYAKQHIDMAAFAAFEAIDVVFGVEQHGFKENQKLYFDPYKGSWVPVAWDLRGFKHDGVINRVENPITIRLKMMPEYRAMRNAAVWKLLVGDASINQIRKRTRKLLAKLAPELVNDRLFSAYKQLPKVNEFAFKMLRPMNMERLALVLKSEMMSFGRRHAFLMNQLQKNEFFYRLGETQEPPASQLNSVGGVAEDDVENGDVKNYEEVEQRYHTPLELIVAGQADIALEKLAVQFDNCPSPDWKILWKGRQVTHASKNHTSDFSVEKVLSAAVMLVERKKGDADLNKIKVETIPTPHSFVIDSNCNPSAVEIWGTHQITANRIRAQKAPVDLLAQIPDTFPSDSAIPKLKIGTLAPHPETLKKNRVHEVQVGPGPVVVSNTKVYDEYTDVTVAAGTVFEMGKKASLIFHGKVTMEGTASQPIVFKGSGKKVWGGVAVQGPYTEGSVLKNVVLERGSHIKGQSVVYTSVLNIHHTQNILVEGCTIRKNKGSGDGFHSAYVKELVLRDIRIENVKMDAIDIEFSTGQITRAWIQNAGDDGIDLMDSKIRVSDSVVLGCFQHGISAGEHSSLQATDFLVAWSRNGIFAKDSSHVQIETGLLMHNDTGVRVGKPTGLYGDDVEVAANILYILGAQKSVVRGDRKKNKLDDGQILFGFVDERPLRHLFDDVLNIKDSKQLDGWMKEREARQ